MARGINTAMSPARRPSSIGIVHPSTDGGISSRDAGPVIQGNWERMRDAGMSAQDATARMHGNLSIQMPQRMTDPVVAFTQDNQPRYTNSYGPVGQIMNRHQSTVA